MKAVNIVIKPLGIIAGSVLAVTLVAAVAIPRMRAGGSGGASPVGAAAKSEFPITPDMTPPEIEEANLMRQWNEAPGQKRDWLFLGPLSAKSQIRDVSNTGDGMGQMRRIIETAYLPDEAKYQARENAPVTYEGRSYNWRKVNGSAFNFKQVFRDSSEVKNVVVYGVATIQSEKDQTRIARFHSDDGAVVWVNGTPVHKVIAIRGMKDEDKIKLPLHKGSNTILVKVGQGEGGWGMVFQLEDPS